MDHVTFSVKPYNPKLIMFKCSFSCVHLAPIKILMLEREDLTYAL